MVSLENIKSSLQVITDISREALQLSTESSTAQANPPIPESQELLPESVHPRSGVPPLSHASTGPPFFPAGEGITGEGYLSPRPGLTARVPGAATARLPGAATTGSLPRATSAPTAVMQQGAREYLASQGARAAIHYPSGQGKDTSAAVEGLHPALSGIVTGWQVLTESTRDTLQVEVTSAGGSLSSLSTSVLEGTHSGVTEAESTSSAKEPSGSRLVQRAESSVGTGGGRGSEASLPKGEGGGILSGASSLSAKIVPEKISDEDMHKALSVLGSS